MKLSLSQKLYFGFGSIVGMVVLLCIMLIAEMNRDSQDGGRDLDTCRRVQIAAANVWQFITDASLTKDSAVIREEARPNYETADSLLTVLIQNNRNSPEHLAKWVEIKKNLPNMWNTGISMFNAYLISFEQGNIEMDKYDKACDQVIRQVEMVVDLENSDYEKAVLQKQQFAGFTAVFMTILVVAAAVIICILLTNHISGSLNRAKDRLVISSNRVADAAHTVAGSSETIAAGAESQLEMLYETKQSMQTLSESITSNAAKGIEAQQLTAISARFSAEGVESVNRLNSAVHAIHISSKEMAKIVQTIDEIAFQTNLLALNAAVEAAHVGSAGAGFAVVAEEVRKLAQRSSAAAQSTAVLIKEALKNSEYGVEISEQAAESISRLHENFMHASALITAAAQANAKQELSVQAASDSAECMSSVVEQNSAGAKECSDASADLAVQADEVRSAVHLLEVLLNGEREPH